MDDWIVPLIAGTDAQWTYTPYIESDYSTVWECGGIRRWASALISSMPVTSYRWPRSNPLAVWPVTADQADLLIHAFAADFGLYELNLWGVEPINGEARWRLTLGTRNAKVSARPYVAKPNEVQVAVPGQDNARVWHSTLTPLACYHVASLALASTPLHGRLPLGGFSADGRQVSVSVAGIIGDDLRPAVQGFARVLAAEFQRRCGEEWWFSCRHILENRPWKSGPLFESANCSINFQGPAHTEKAAAISPKIDADWHHEKGFEWNAAKAR
jgi:hypothetical protein